MTGQPASSPDYSILSAFPPVVARPRPSAVYQLSLLLVAITMLLLPLIYLAMVGAVGYAVYYHATHHWTALMGFAQGGGALVVALMFLCYLIPVLVGGLIVFVMLKPLFAGSPGHAQPLALNPADNPLLYAFIEKICDTVGAPSPRRIDLDCHLNASVGFRRGLESMIDDDLVLTIGLPLVANLTAAEFAGVVAHEFGHFNQRLGLRLSYIIRGVNRWFFRAVYQRDAWDDGLRQWAEDTDSRWVTALCWVAQIVVFCERMVLSALMYTGRLIGGLMIRQMEFDADACEIRLVGSETFERTHRKLATLDAAAQHMRLQMRKVWRSSGQLPDNICELLRQAHEALPDTVLEKIATSYGIKPTGLFDSHPSPADRIRRARRAQDAGAFHDERPAASLFSSFEHPARFVTMLYYSDELGIPITREMLSHVETADGTPQNRAQTHSLKTSALHDEYFLGILPLLLPLHMELPTPSSDYEADSTALAQLVAGLHAAREQLSAIGQQYEEAAQQLVQARAAVRLLEARVPIKGDEFGLAEATLKFAHTRETEAMAARAELRHSVREASAALQQRLQIALALKMSDLSGQAGDDLVSRAAAQIQSATADYPAKLEIAEALAVLDRIVALRDREGESPALSRALVAQMEVINHLRPRPDYLPAEKPAHPAVHLQLSRKPKHEGLAELKPLRQQTEQWFVDYHANLNALVEAAHAGESATV